MMKVIKLIFDVIANVILGTLFMGSAVSTDDIKFERNVRK